MDLDDDSWTLIKSKSHLPMYSSSNSVIPLPRTTINAKLDSAASNHYWALRDTMALDEVQDDDIGVSTILPDKSIITSIQRAHLPIQNLSKVATDTKIFSDLNHNLISAGQLVDDNCKVLLRKKDCIVWKDNNIILQGKRSTSGDRLWDIPIPQLQPSSTIVSPSQSSTPQNHSINIILRTDKKSSDLAQFHHGSCNSPKSDTFVKGIRNNYFTTWPGLTPELITKHLPPTIATELGHLKQEQQGLRSTKNILPPTINHITEEECFFPSYDPSYRRTNDCVYMIYSTSDKAFMDLTGRFPYRSTRGNEYILNCYHYDSNTILGQPLKNRQAATITKAWQSLQNELTIAGVAPNTWVLDNETSHQLQQTMTKNNTTFEFVPPHTHRANLAERAIQTFKCHFKSTLATVDPTFPIQEWDRLLKQAFMTLNMLRGARLNSKLSAYAFLFGQFDYNKTPLAPPGTKAVIHSKPTNRATWDYNGKVGYYIGPSMNHYRCMQFFMPQSKSIIHCDTVTFIPHLIPIPETSIEDFIRQAAGDIVTLLTTPPSSTTPILQLGDSTRNGLLQLSTLFHRNQVTNSLIRQ